MTIAEIIELVGLIITGIGLAFSIYKWVKEVKQKDLKAIIEKAMIEAEKTGLDGNKKLEYVLKILKAEYLDGYKKIEKFAKSYIEDCILFSKKINHK